MSMPATFAFWAGDKRPKCRACGDPIWRYHRLGFLRCNEHIKDCCPLMEIPAEIRLLIYEHLLPDQAIHALKQYDESLLGQGALERESGIYKLAKSDEGETNSVEVDGSEADEEPNLVDKEFENWNCTTPLRVCKQMSEEYEPILYGYPTFSINTGHRSYDEPPQQTWAKLCFEEAFWYNIHPDPRPLTGDRSIEAENEDEEGSWEQSNISSFTENHKTWYPKLGSHYFNQIRNFQVTITLNHRRGWNTSDPLSENALYEYTDYLHALVSRLKRCKKIRNLTIDMHFVSDFTAMSAEHHVAAQIFLEPFRRLQNVSRFQVRSITGECIDDPVVDVLKLDCKESWEEAGQTENEFFQDRPPLDAFLVQLRKDIQRKTNVSTSDPPMLGLYWKIQKELEHMKLFDSWARTHESDYLSIQRKAREQNNLTKFQTAWSVFMEGWKTWRMDQMVFMAAADIQLGMITDAIKLAASKDKDTEVNNK